MSRLFCAKLLGCNEIPPVRTRAFGFIKLKLTREENLLYRMKVNRIKNLTQAHLHLGFKDENGPVVAFLFNAAPIDGKSGVISVNKGIVTGIIRDDDLVGPLEGQTICDLVERIKIRQIYTNVHTVQNPSGEIRGQVCKVHY